MKFIYKSIFVIHAIFFGFSFAKEIYPELIIDQLNAGNVEFVDFMFSDLLGNLRSVTIPMVEVSRALKNGISFDGSSIPGFTSITESDLMLVPDLHTLTIINSNTARIICDIYVDKKHPFNGDPRYVLKKILQEAHDLGYEFLVGPELEFFLFELSDAKQLVPSDNGKYFQAESIIERDIQNKTLLNILLQQGINVEKLHHEVAPGQHEVSIHYGDALAIADQVLLCKHAIKSFAKLHSYQATFMPKPIADQNGSGMHIHFSLRDLKSNQNAFYNKTDSKLLSDVAYNFIAGVLYYASDVNALFNSSLNSYKRLVPGYEAPIYRCWATKNRSAMIRIPHIESDQISAARAEIRSPDGLCNPYLAFAALLKAGLEGIKNNIEIPAATEFNLYHLNTQELIAKGIDTLPPSLTDSLSFFKSSKLVEDLLGKTMRNEYLKLKEEELLSSQRNITAWELEHYL